MSDSVMGLPAYIRGFFTVLAGVFFIVFPEATAGAIGYILGITLVVVGISGTVDYIMSMRSFKQEEGGSLPGAEMLLLYSLMSVIIGAVFIVKPDIVLSLISFIAGALFVADGVVKFQESFRSEVLPGFMRVMLVIVSIAVIASGIALMFNPFSGTRAIIVFTGIILVVSGFETVVIGLKKMS